MIATDEDNNITCYVMLFKPEDFYEKVELECNDITNSAEDIYTCSIDWSLIIKELTHQGNANRVIFIKK